MTFDKYDKASAIGAATALPFGVIMNGWLLGIVGSVAGFAIMYCVDRFFRWLHK